MTKSEWELKKLLRKYDDVELPMDGKFYDRMHNSIMMRIDDIDSRAPKRGSRMKESLQAHWKSWFNTTNSSLKNT